jgi:DNA-binding protein HU-beta
MATKKRSKGTLKKVTETVKDAALAVAKTTGDYVVEPVSKALGLNAKKKSTKRPAAKKKAAPKTAAKKTTAKSSAKKTPARKRTTQSGK